jgi:hypothetical protein
MPAVKFYTILGVCAYLTLIEKSNYSRHPKGYIRAVSRMLHPADLSLYKKRELSCDYAINKSGFLFFYSGYGARKRWTGEGEECLALWNS